jgi:hypothetical protein
LQRPAAAHTPTLPSERHTNCHNYIQQQQASLQFNSQPSSSTQLHKHNNFRTTQHTVHKHQHYLQQFNTHSLTILG